MRLIDTDAAIDALWKALYKYEDKTEKQFIESEELDVADWIQHRIFVQNMSDIDRQTILALPSAHQWIPVSERWPDDDGVYLVTYKGVTNVALFAWGGWTIGTEDGMGQALPDAWMPLPEPYKGE